MSGSGTLSKRPGLTNGAAYCGRFAAQPEGGIPGQAVKTSAGCPTEIVGETAKLRSMARYRSEGALNIIFIISTTDCSRHKKADRQNRSAFGRLPG